VSNRAAEGAKRAKSFLSFLAWWKTDPQEIEKQVAQYHTLRVWQSARGISLLLCMFTVAATALLRGPMNLSGEAIIVEAVIWTVVGFLMYRGQKWAFVAGMVLWTISKATLVFNGAAPGTPFVQVIWWAIYMNAFMLGFRVEKSRATRRVAPARQAVAR
jgi:hypothetical protein